MSAEKLTFDKEGRFYDYKQQNKKGLN